MKILAIDQSIKNTGFCLYESDKKYKLELFQQKKTDDKKYLLNMFDKLDKLYMEYKFDVLAREDYAFASKTNVITQLAELGGIIDLFCLIRDIKEYIVPIYSWKKHLLGKSMRKDTNYLLNFYKVTNIMFDNDNLSDAYGIGRYVSDYLKNPTADEFKKFHKG